MLGEEFLSLAEDVNALGELRRIEYEGVGLKYLHSNVKRVLMSNPRCEGVVYGGYVRDVVLKVIAFDFSLTDTKDVDIWFESSEDRDHFLSSRSSTIRVITKEGCHGGASIGTDSVMTSLVDEYGSHLIYFDCVVSSYPPVYDMDVNYLTWSPEEDKVRAHGGYDLPELVLCIREKHAHLTRICTDIIHGNCHANIVIPDKLTIKLRKRITERFIQKGWTITDANGETVDSRVLSTLSRNR